MEAPAKEYPAGTWFADRIDGKDARRRRLRWYALAFNGLFLQAVGLNDLGAFLMIVAIAVLARQFMLRRNRMRPLTAALDTGGHAPIEPVRMEIYRDGALLGADEGWLGRRNGALAYEGRQTRFEIVEADLEIVPMNYVTPWEKTRLNVRGGDGWVEVEFRPWSSEDSARKRIQAILTDWPWATRRLSGPPSAPNPRRPNGFLFVQAAEKIMAMAMIAVFGVIILGAVVHMTARQSFLLQLTLVLSIAAVTFSKAYRKDRQGVAWLEADDREARLNGTRAAIEHEDPPHVRTIVR